MKTNIVLTGLMGVGKTTVGKIVAHRLKMGFIDVDEEIERLHGPIPGLFEKGESFFRDVESRVIMDLAEHDNMVISTGGGVVLRKSNMEALSGKALIFYLKRPVEDIISTIETSTRPLLKNGADVLYRLNAEREPLYIKYCNYIIDASDSEQAADRIIAHWLKKES